MGHCLGCRGRPGRSMGLRWVLAVFDLRFGVEFGHFGSVLRDGMIAVVGFAGGVLWLAGGLLPCAVLVRA